MVLWSLFVNLASILSTHEQQTGSGELHNTFSARLLFCISMLQRLSIQINSGNQKVRGKNEVNFFLVIIIIISFIYYELC